MNKKYITIFVFIILGLILSYYKIEKNTINNTNNLWILTVILVIVFSLPNIFPSFKKIGMGTLDFYPNLFKKIFKK